MFNLDELQALRLNVLAREDQTSGWLDRNTPAIDAALTREVHEMTEVDVLMLKAAVRTLRVRLAVVQMLNDEMRGKAGA